MFLFFKPECPRRQLRADMVPTKYLTKIVGLALALHCNCLQAVHAAHAAADRGGGAAPADAIGIAIAAVAASTPKSWQVSLIYNIRLSPCQVGFKYQVIAVHLKLHCECVCTQCTIDLVLMIILCALCVTARKMLRRIQ